uniref:Uncharacterized protein n=1 Tax=Timema tahoe TaxID=61484 RepID=A0A7R9FF00_9NEOP|nr:unnamed protein product [Timema tahoe]
MSREVVGTGIVVVTLLIRKRLEEELENKKNMGKKLDLKTSMADIKQELKTADDQQNYSVGNSTDPKNMQELTQYITQTGNDDGDDEMGNRIDDLEKNIADLMTQAGVEGPDK